MFRILRYKRFQIRRRLPQLVLTFTKVLVVFVLFKFLTGRFRNAYFNTEVERPSSTCSLTADRRGPHQKVIAYSIFGDFSQQEVVNRYLKPFRKTLETIPSIYPGWIVRIYHNQTNDDSVTSTWTMLRKELNVGIHVDVCNATEILHYRKMNNVISGTTWRWLPLIDEMVDTFMSRDSDSPIIQREEDAVGEWLASDRVFHIMRDHHDHCTSILAGMWGAKVSQDRFKIAAASRQILEKNHRFEYGYDQLLLSDYIWPLARKNMMAHDSYCCKRFPNVRPFPTKRIGVLFIGSRGLPGEGLKFSCPKKCRPMNATTPDWKFC